MIDASLAIWAILPKWSGVNIDILRRFGNWRSTGQQVIAPAMWTAECTSAIRRGIYTREISLDKGRTALIDLFALDVQIVPLSIALCESALEWGERLKQVRAYDAFYLALAEQRSAEFWTADQRLANGARQAGFRGAHWIGES